MSKDKYPCIFSSQMETIVFIILQIFFATRAVLKIGEYCPIFPSFSRGIFGSRVAFRPIMFHDNIKCKLEKNQAS